VRKAGGRRCEGLCEGDWAEKKVKRHEGLGRKKKVRSEMEEG
jgi:hypothetical protein